MEEWRDSSIEALSEEDRRYYADKKYNAFVGVWVQQVKTLRLLLREDGYDLIIKKKAGFSRPAFFIEKLLN